MMGSVGLIAALALLGVTFGLMLVFVSIAFTYAEQEDVQTGRMSYYGGPIVGSGYYPLLDEDGADESEAGEGDG